MSRKSGLVAPVMEAARKLDEEGADRARFIAELEKASGRFNRLQARMLEAMEKGSNFEAYRDGLTEALADAFSLLQAGLDEVAHYQPGGDRRPLRIGRLLMEKGEQEYLAVLEILQSDNLGSERERTVDLWGQLLTEAGKVAAGDLTQREFQEILAWGEWALGAHMDGTFRDFQRALVALRARPEVPQAAHHRALSSLRRLQEFLGLTLPSEPAPEPIQPALQTRANGDDDPLPLLSGLNPL